MGLNSTVHNIWLYWSSLKPFTKSIADTDAQRKIKLYSSISLYKMSYLNIQY